MITAPANYSTELAKAGRAPSYAVNLDSGGAANLQYVSEPMKNGGDFATALAVLRPVSLKTAVDPRKSRFVPPVFVFELIDDQALVTADLTVDITGWVCTFYHMFHGLDWSVPDYITRFVGIVTEVPKYKSGRYQIMARSPFSTAALPSKLFAGVKMVLNNDLAVDAIEAVVTDASAAQEGGGFVVNGAERILYTSTRDNGSGTWSLLGLTRGYGGSTAETADPGDAIQEIFIFAADHPFDMIQTILTNTGKKDGLSFDSAYIDATGFSGAKTDLGAFDFYIEATKSQNSKRFLEEQLFRPTASYPAENNLGQLRPVLLDTPDAGDFVATISDAEVKGEPIFRGRFEFRVNDVIIDHDEDLVNLDQSFESQYRKTDGNLVTLAGRRHTFQFSAKGIQSTTAGAAAFLEGRGDSFIERFGLQAPVLEFVAAMSQELLEVADPIYCTFINVINLPAATRGMTAYPFAIVDMGIDYVRGHINFRVLGYPPLAEIPDQSFAGTTVHSITGLSMTVA